MQSTTAAYSQLPLYSQGSLKAFQRAGGYFNLSICTIKQLNNFISAFKTPAFIENSAIQNITLYKLSNKVAAATTYAEFVANRDSGVPLNIAPTLHNKGIYYYYLHVGSLIDTLAAGLYEFVIMLNSGVTFESEVLRICTEAKATSSYGYVDENGDFYVDENGDFYVDETF